MAFNAGSIEATLTLNRNPFTAGLRAAQQQARAFKPINVTVNFKPGQTARQLDALQKKANKFAGTYVARARVAVDDRAFRNLQRRLQGFNNKIYTATAKVINQTVGQAAKAAGNVTSNVNVNTSAATAQVNNFRNQAQRSIWIPLIVDPSQATNSTERLRLQLQNLKNSAIVSPRFEERQFIDQYGRVRTRLVKVSRDHGTFAGEAFSRNMIRSMVNAKYVVAMMPVRAAIVALFSSAAIGASSAFFGALAFNALRDMQPLKAAIDSTKASLDALIQTEAAPLMDQFVGLMGAVRNAGQAVRYDLGNIFNDLQPQVDRAAASILVIASNVMPALSDAVAASDVVVDGFFDGVEEASRGVRRFIDAIITSAPQAGQTFRTIGVVIADVMEMIGFLGAAVNRLFGGQIWNEFEAVFESVTNIVERFVTSALPQFGTGLEVALTVLEGVLSVIEPIAGILGTWVGTFAGIAIAVRGFSTAIGILAGAFTLLNGAIAKAAISKFALQLGNAGLAAALFTTRMTGSAKAGDAVANGTSKAVGAMDKLGRALPFVGAGLIGIGLAYDEMKSKAEESATGVLNGSMSMQDAINAERNQIEKRTLAHAFWLTEAKQAEKVAEANAQASRNVRDAMREQMAQMTPLEQAQAKLNLAQGHYKDMVAEFTANSPQAIAAQQGIAVAAKELEIAEREAARQTELHTDAIIRQRDEILSSIDSSFAYRNSLNALEDAQKASAEAVRDHGAKSEEASRAFLAEEEAAFRVAKAASQKAFDENIAKGESVAHEAATRALIAELERQAATSTGPVKDSLLGMVQDLKGASGATADADRAATTYKDDLQRLADQTNGPLADALRTAAGNFDALGGAHASAGTQASLQTDELLGLARMANGQTRDSLLNLAGTINDLPDGHFQVTAEGKVTYDTARKLLNNPNTYGSASGGILPTPGTWGAYARGGVMPGYTPGRDVHRFASPTGGMLELSGGEAVMRPEFTRVVGPGFVDAANKAARAGGIRGVQRLLGGRREHPKGGFAAGGIQKFAMGGTIGMQGMQPFKNTGLHQYDVATEAYEQWVAPKLAAVLRKMISEATARMGTASGGGGWQWQMNVLRQAFPGLPLISGYRPGAITATGNRSYHAQGRAVDIPPRMDVFNWIKGTYGANSKEIIFSPAGGGQVWNGRPHMYGEPTRGDHWDHVHWAYNQGGVIPRVKEFDQGGILEPGATLALNNTGKNEFVSTNEPTSNQDVVEKLDTLINLLSSQGAGANINVQGQSADPVETARATVLALRLTR